MKSRELFCKSTSPDKIRTNMLRAAKYRQRKWAKVTTICPKENPFFQMQEQMRIRLVCWGTAWGQYFSASCSYWIFVLTSISKMELRGQNVCQSGNHSTAGNSELRATTSARGLLDVSSHFTCGFSKPVVLTEYSPAAYLQIESVFFKFWFSRENKKKLMPFCCLSVAQVCELPCLSHCFHTLYAETA